MDKAKAVMEQSAVAANKLHLNSKKIEAQCGKVQMEVEKFIENYIKSVEDHKTNLLEQIQQVGPLCCSLLGYNVCVAGEGGEDRVDKSGEGEPAEEDKRSQRSGLLFG